MKTKIMIAACAVLLTVMVGCSGNQKLPVTVDPSMVTQESVMSPAEMDKTQAWDATEETSGSTDDEGMPQTELNYSEGIEVDTSVSETKTAEMSDSTAVQESTAHVVETSIATSSEETVESTTEKVVEVSPETEAQTKHESTNEPSTTEESTTEVHVPRSMSVKVRGEYYIGDMLSAGDFIVTVIMSDGSTKKNPAGWSADPLYLASHETVIMVTYQELTAQVTVNASERPTEAPTTDASIEAPTDSSIQEPVQPPMSLDRTAAETAWNIQKGIIESQAFNLDTMDYTGKPIAWSERLYELACQRAKEIVDNFSHDGFHSIDASAENIAKGVPYPDMVINGWYNSAGHKNNMLGGWNYGAIAKYGSYWVALFSNNP